MGGFFAGLLGLMGLGGFVWLLAREDPIYKPEYWKTIEAGYRRQGKKWPPDPETDPLSASDYQEFLESQKKKKKPA